MANALSGNTYYIDTVSSDSDNFLESKSVQVMGIIYFSSASAKYITINELTAQNTAGAKKISVGVDASHGTQYIDLVDAPIRFTNGIWVSALTGGECTLILKFN